MAKHYRRVLLVRNPASGGAKADVYSELEGVLGGIGDVSVCEPSSAEDFASDVQTAATDVDLVVVAGGDGTVNSTVNALKSSLQDITLSVVPLGTGNDLARTLGLDDEPIEIARGLVAGVERSIDLGVASGTGVERLFVNACIGGFPVEVDHEINEVMKKTLGPLAFVVGGIKALPGMERSTVAINGREVSDCIAVGVGNGRTCGGGVEVWPHARPDDGLLDCAALCPSNLPEAVSLGKKVRTGTHEELESVTTLRAEKVHVTAEPGIEFNVDGEVLGLKSPASFEIAGRVRFLVPHRSKNS